MKIWWFQWCSSGSLFAIIEMKEEEEKKYCAMSYYFNCFTIISSFQLLPQIKLHSFLSTYHFSMQQTINVHYSHFCRIFSVFFFPFFFFFLLVIFYFAWKYYVFGCLHMKIISFLYFWNEFLMKIIILFVFVNFTFIIDWIVGKKERKKKLKYA